LNLPFYDDEEFAKLHAAVRLVLPIIPALCASSPILEGNISGSHDTRLKYYKSNQARIPSITGRVIPEAVFSKRNYLNSIYEKIKTDIAPFDPEGVLNPIWVNSRGAIPRFDRGSIEIRLMDVQECPVADIAVLTLVIETVKALVTGKFADHESQMKFKTDTLVPIYEVCVEGAEFALVEDRDFIKTFVAREESMSAGELWAGILDRLIYLGNDALRQWKPELDIILKEGTLSTRIMKSLDGDNSHEKISEVYRQLVDCLAQNKMFFS
jgi:carboxylate-amine ligase